MALGDTTIIADVTEMLGQLLSDLEVTFDSPAAIKGSTDGNSYAAINLYLYQALENPFAKNQPWKSINLNRKAYPPLALNLYYLLTPYASDAKSAHSVLGHAMKVLYDNSIIEKTQLPVTLRLIVEQLSISLCPLKLEELTRIWNALQTPYRLSVAYEVKILLLESEQQKTISRVEGKSIIYSHKKK